jgi:hypothetical protein
MAKAAISRRLLFILLIAALFAAGAFLSQKAESQKSVGTPVEPPGVPTVKKSGKADRLDGELWDKWHGKPMAEILAALAPVAAPANPAPLDPAADPDGVEIDPFLPRFEPVAGLVLPPAEDATALYGHLILSATGSPLSVWRLTDGRAEDITAASGLSGVPGGKRCLAADFDRDGDLDLFIGRGGQAPDSLLRRTGEKTFEDVTEAFGLLEFLDLADAAWVDFDRDGWLDLCLLQKTASGAVIRLFHNQSGSAFSDLAAASGLTGSLACDRLIWRDFDDDGFPDLVLSGEKPRAFQSIPGDTADSRRFGDVAAGSGVPVLAAGGPMAAADLNGDGRSDLAMATKGGIDLYLSDSTEPGGFAARRLESVAAPVAIAATDFDRDGIPDLVVSGDNGETRSWWNAGNAEFREIAGAAGLSASAPVTRLLAFDPADAGSPGMLICGGPQRLSSFRKAESALAGDRARIALRLTGPDSANRNAIGARVSITIRDRKFVYSTISLVVESPTEVVGLGEAAAIESIEIVWPDRARTKTQLSGQPVNSLLEIGPDPASVTHRPLPP